MKCKPWATAAVIVATALVLSGCGRQTVLETYSFGQVQLKVGNSELYMASPFDLGRVKRQDDPGIIYGGEDRHLTVIALAEPANTTTVEQSAAYLITMLQQTAEISDLQTKSKPTMIGNRPALEVTCQYNKLTDGQAIGIIMRSLFFEDKGQIWHIQYAYRSDDALGKAAIERVFGHIQ